MRASKECKYIVLATLILLAVVQPGATMDAPYNLARSVSTWGEAFVGGSPLLLAYALVRLPTALSAVRAEGTAASPRRKRLIAFPGCRKRPVHLQESHL